MDFVLFYSNALEIQKTTASYGLFNLAISTVDVCRYSLLL